MGALADLILDATGQPMSLIAAAFGLPPLLFLRIDQGLQPMPAELGARVAAFIGVGLWQVQASVREWAVVVDPNLYTPIPARLGESFPALKIAQTAPVQVPAPAALPSNIQVDLTGVPGVLEVDLTGVPGNIQIG